MCPWKYQIYFRVPEQTSIKDISTGSNGFKTAMLYDPRHADLAYTCDMPCKEHLLHAAREILRDDVLYDPEDSDMHIHQDDLFRFHVSLGLWHIALQEGLRERRRRFFF